MMKMMAGLRSRHIAENQMMQMKMGELQIMQKMAEREMEQMAERKAAAKLASSDLIELIKFQTADGYWQASALAKLQSFFKLSLPTHLPIEIICTLAALLVLEDFFDDQATEWALIQKKAKDYLKNKGVNLTTEMDNLSNYQ